MKAAPALCSFLALGSSIEWKNGVVFFFFFKKQLEINSNFVRRQFCHAKHIFLRQRLDAVGFKRCEVEQSTNQNSFLWARVHQKPHPLPATGYLASNELISWPEVILPYEIVQKRVDIAGLRLFSLIRPACNAGPHLATGKPTGKQLPSWVWNFPSW